MTDLTYKLDVDGHCQTQIEAAKISWRKAKQACAEVEQRLGRLQRATSSTEALAETTELQTEFRQALNQVNESAASLRRIDDYCYGL